MIAMPRQIQSKGQYGPIPAGFEVELKSRYTALIGPNNAGKSALLQLAFKSAIEEFGPDNVCYIGADRGWIQANTQPGGRTLANYNEQLHQRLRSEPMQFQEGTYGPVGGELFRLLLHRGDFQRQLQDTQDYLSRLGLPPFLIRGQQDVTFESVVAAAQGSGLRGLLPIVAAIATRELQMIAIDEPELALEPILAKALRNLLIESAERRLIVVATHSHLLPNRDDVASTIRVAREGGFVRVDPVADEQQLAEITFEMLGNSTEDLFFPGNFLVVEGASDQALAARVLELTGIPNGKVKVLSAEGIDGIGDTIAAVQRALVPLWTRDSPYSSRVVALIDGGGKPAVVERLRGHLEGRLFVLPATSLEDYLPDSVYAKAGEDKQRVLVELHSAGGDYAKQSAIKARISARIAASMSAGDLDGIPHFRDAVARAVALAS